MTDLHDLLDLSTDRIESPDLAPRALAGAGRRRAARRAVGASAALAGVVVCVAVVGWLGGRNSGSMPAVNTPTPSRSPTVALTQAPWDPFTVDDLPAAPADVAPVLPDVIEPSSVAPWLTDEPMDAAVLAFAGEDGVSLLGVDGTWRSVPMPATNLEFPWVELSADGTQLGIGTHAGITVWDLASADKSFLTLPDDYRVNADDSVVFTWVADQVLLDNRQPGEGGWLLDTPPSKPVAEPYPRGGGDINHASVDDAGVVVESSFDLDRAWFVDWLDGKPHRIDLDIKDRLTTLVADANHVVGTRGFAVVVLDRFDLSPMAVLPLDDADNNFGDGKSPVLALLQDDTVLFQVPAIGRLDGWSVVAWNPATGGLSRVARGEGPVPASFAVGLLG